MRVGLVNLHCVTFGKVEYKDSLCFYIATLLNPNIILSKTFVSYLGQNVTQIDALVTLALVTHMSETGGQQRFVLLGE